MTITSIPCTPSGQPFWNQRTTLSGQDYLLSFQWSQRDGHWFLSLADADNSPIFSGRKLVDSANLFARLLDPRLPPGALIVLDTQLAGKDPDFSDLDSRCLLFYDDGQP